MFNLGLLYYNQEKYDNAEKYLKMALEYGHKDAKILLDNIKIELKNKISREATIS